MAGEQVLYGRPQFPAQLDMSHHLTRGLVGCWILNENSPNSMRAWDSSPYRNHGLVTGAGGRWQGRYFDGTNNNRVTVPRSGSIEPAEFYIEAWVYPTAFDSSYSVILGKDQTSHIEPYYSYHFRTDSVGTFWFGWNDGTTLQSITGGILSTGVRTHLGVNFRQGEQAVYRNTLIVASSTRSDTISYFDSSLIIGTSLNLGVASDFIGIIALVRIWNRYLIAENRRELYLHPYDMFVR